MKSNNKINELLKCSLGYMKCKWNKIYCKGNCFVGLHVKITNLGVSQFGNGVTIRSYSFLSVNPSASLRIGANSEIGGYSVIASHFNIVIEDGVLTGPHVFIADYNHEYRNPQIPVYLQGEMAPKDSHVFIGRGSWIGTNVVIVGKVHIGRQCVIGANSVVTKDIPDYCVAAGIPCRIIRRYDFNKSEWVKV